MNNNKKKSLLVPILCATLCVSIFIGIGVKSVKAGWSETGIPGSFNVHFPDRSHSTLSFTIRTTYCYVSYDPVLYFSIDERFSDPHSRFLRIYVDDYFIYEKTISNDYSGSIEIKALRASGTHTITIEVYHGAYDRGPYWLNYLKLSRLGWDQNYEKIAVFSWHEWESSKPDDSGIISENILDHYVNRVQSFGYTCIKHKNPTNWRADMIDLDNMEDANSVIFLYFAGHGSYSRFFDYSYLKLSPSQHMGSASLEYYVDRLESHRIFVMIDGCYCGDFRDELNQDKVSVITSTDQSHKSYGYSGNDWSVPIFTYHFFDRAGVFNHAENRYHDDLDAFYYAESTCENAPTYKQYPESSFRAWHSFFGP